MQGSQEQKKHEYMLVRSVDHGFLSLDSYDSHQKANAVMNSEASQLYSSIIEKDGEREDLFIEVARSMAKISASEGSRIWQWDIIEI